MAKGRRGRGDGSIFYSESKACWVWRACTGYHPDGSVRHTEGRARTQGAAIAAKREAEKQNRLPNGDRTTVGEFLTYWLDDVAKPNVRVNTWSSYERCVRLHLAPHVGGVPLAKLDTPAVNRLWAKLARAGMSPGNVKKCSEVLASALEHAVSEGKIPTAPTRAAVKPTVPTPTIEVFTDDEVQLLLGAADGDRLEALYVLAVATGMREGELFGLDSADVNLAGRTINVRRSLEESKGGFSLNPPKSARGIRTVSLPVFAVDVLRRHLAGREPGTVFTSTTGTFIGRSNFVRRDWCSLLTRANVRHRKFHTLRHTHASRLLAAGVDPAEVARRIGDSIETLMRSYAHWVNTAGRDTAAKVDAIYGKPGPRLASLPLETPEGSRDESGNPQGGGKVAA